MYEISNQMKNEESNVIIDSPLARLFKFVILVIPLYPKLRKLCRKNSKRLYESTLGPKLLKNVEKKMVMLAVLEIWVVTVWLLWVLMKD